MSSAWKAKDYKGFSKLQGRVLRPPLQEEFEGLVVPE